MDSTRDKSNGYYNSAMRWIEDTYLKYFGENRTSYGVKESFKKTEITGNEDIDGIQRATGNAVGNTVGANGIGGSVGNMVDKGVLRGNV